MKAISTSCSALALVLAMSALMTPAVARAEAGDWILRGRFIVVAPNESSGGITPAFPAERVSVDNAVAPELDITYMVTNNLGIELIAATTKHSVSGVSGTTGSIGRLASTWVLPPTVTLQYHFMPDGAIRPYVGAGLNYTIFYNERASGGLESAVGATSVRLSDSFGWALQAGADVALGKNLFLNLDVKYIDMDTKARLNTAAAGQQTVRVSIDPLVFGVGLGIRF